MENYPKVFEAPNTESVPAFVLPGSSDIMIITSKTNGL